MTEFDSIIKKIDEQNILIKQHRPLTEHEANQLQNFFKVEITYSSNAIEGNTLTLTETKVLLEDGLTVGGKPIGDYLEASGHAKAYDFMLSLTGNTDHHITEEEIKKLHCLFYSGIDPEFAGEYRKQKVFITGTEYVPPEPGAIPELMRIFVEELNTLRRVVHPIDIATFAHQRLVDIHPFIDGNGRTARLLMNLELIRQGYLPISIPPVLRSEYIGAIMNSRAGRKEDTETLNLFIAKQEFETQKDYMRMLGVSKEPEIRTAHSQEGLLYSTEEPNRK